MPARLICPSTHSQLCEFSATRSADNGYSSESFSESRRKDFESRVTNLRSWHKSRAMMSLPRPSRCVQSVINQRGGVIREIKPLDLADLDNVSTIRYYTTIYVRQTFKTYNCQYTVKRKVQRRRRRLGKIFDQSPRGERKFRWNEARFQFCSRNLVTHFQFSHFEENVKQSGNLEKPAANSAGEFTTDSLYTLHANFSAREIYIPFSSFSPKPVYLSGNFQSKPPSSPPLPRRDSALVNLTQNNLFMNFSCESPR